MTHGTDNYDVLIIGGGAAGLAAALQLGRVRRRVIVVDARQPRNQPAHSMHGYLGYEGEAPSVLLERGRKEAEVYGARIVDDTVISLARTQDATFEARFGQGGTVRARRVLLATGVADALPDIPGLWEHWGSAAVHCPYCHGWEVRDEEIVVIATGPASIHQAHMFRQLTDHLTIVAHGYEIEGSDRFRLNARGIAIEDGPVVEVLNDEDGHLCGVRIENGSVLRAGAVVVAPRSTARTGLLDGFGVTKTEQVGIANIVSRDNSGRTEVAGIYVAGDVTAAPARVLGAAADGGYVASQINADLIEEEIDHAVAHLDWDNWYTSHPGGRWSGRPNGSLVQQITDLEPGRALDVGCGEGADAIWLADRGWMVTGIDISSVAIERARSAATRAGADVEWRVGDVDESTAERDAYDLVTMHYPALPRPDSGERLDTVLSAVALDGTLLVVFHALPDTEHGKDHGFDPGDYIHIEDIVERLTDDWEIESMQSQPRLGVDESTPHPHDTILRARRLQ